jgi:hypothetical protein
LLEELDSKGNKMTAAERRTAELRTLLIEDFEEKHYPLKAASPADVHSGEIIGPGLLRSLLRDIEMSVQELADQA